MTIKIASNVLARAESLTNAHLYKMLCKLLKNKPLSSFYSIEKREINERKITTVVHIAD